eukprot:sb/3479190/
MVCHVMLTVSYLPGSKTQGLFLSQITYPEAKDQVSRVGVVDFCAFCTCLLCSTRCCSPIVTQPHCYQLAITPVLSGYTRSAVIVFSWRPRRTKQQ